MFGLFKLVSAIVELVGWEDGVWLCGAGIAQDVRLCGDRRRLLGALLWVGSLSGAFDFWDVVFYNMNHLNQRSEP